MSLTLRLLRLATAEFAEASDWYEGRKRGRGMAFTIAVDRVLIQISSDPERYPVTDDEVREASVPGYPYVIYYRILEIEIEVLAVFHTSRDPEVWRRRILDR